MTTEEAEALLVLTPGVFIRAGMQCPHCRRVLHPQPKWRVKGQLLDWSYDCPCCGTVLDGKMSVLRSFEVPR